MTDFEKIRRAFRESGDPHLIDAANTLADASLATLYKVFTGRAA